MSYNVKTPAYSGPFDLLLQLVSRQKLDIGSISIAEVADQYMREVQSMGELDLDVASDFVLVASTLLDMKAAALVPNEPQRPRKEEEEEDDEDDLAQLSPDEAREVLAAAPGVKVVDDPANLRYPMPLDTSDQDLVYVGRIRRDLSAPDGVNALTFFCCGDQIRKGAATNAVQIAERLL